LVAVSRLIGISPAGIVRLFEAKVPYRAGFAGDAFTADFTRMRMTGLNSHCRALLNCRLQWNGFHCAIAEYGWGKSCRSVFADPVKNSEVHRKTNALPVRSVGANDPLRPAVFIVLFERQ